MAANIAEGVIEREQFQSLAEAAGIDAARAILDAFWKSNSDLIAEIRRQLSAGDFAGTAKAAHALKGSAANLGARQLAERARLIEVACKTSNSSEAITAFNSLDADIRDTAGAFDTLMTSLAA